jgi:hypothetical protein
MTTYPNLFAIVPVMPSTDTSGAIVMGDMKEVMEYLPQTHARADAEASLAQARVTADQIATAQMATRALQVANFADAVNRLTRRLDSYETERLERTLREQEEEERKADAKRAAGVKAALDALNAMEPPHHDPGGELHDMPPTAEADNDADNTGDLPKELQPPPPEPPPELENKGEVYPQPISVSLS